MWVVCPTPPIKEGVGGFLVNYYLFVAEDYYLTNPMYKLSIETVVFSV